MLQAENQPPQSIGYAGLNSVQHMNFKDRQDPPNQLLAIHVREQEMKPNKKNLIKDKDLEQDDLVDVSFCRHELVRVYAVGLLFDKVDFSQSIISECYFRNCIFTNCTFQGASISSTNMQGSEFSGCKFLYTTFKQTEVGIDPLSNNLPAEENLKKRLAQNLRVNYASQGDYEGVNFSIRIELAATMEHLKKAAFSREGYYRNKPEHQGWSRFGYVLKFISFWLLDKLWGNGERPSKMLLSIPVIIFFLSGLAAWTSDLGLTQSITATWEAFIIGTPEADLPTAWVVTLSLLRYVALGLFISSLIKRLSRR